MWLVKDGTNSPKPIGIDLYGVASISNPMKPELASKVHVGMQLQWVSGRRLTQISYVLLVTPSHGPVILLPGISSTLN